MGISIEPISILENTPLLLIARRVWSLELCIGVLPVQIFEIFCNVVKHAPVLLHLCKIFHVVCEVSFRLRLQLRILRKHAVDMNSRREESRIPGEWRNNVVVHSLVDKNRDLVRRI